MRRAALNVIGDAIRLTDPGGQVIVSTALGERGEVALRVRDTGTGMTAAEVRAALAPAGRIAERGRRGASGGDVGPAAAAEHQRGEHAHRQQQPTCLSDHAPIPSRHGRFKVCSKNCQVDANDSNARLRSRWVSGRFLSARGNHKGKGNS